MKYEEYIELLKNRRSIRAFTDEKVSEEDIRKIVNAARYAPSGMNYQPWEFVVVRDKTLIEQISRISMDDLKISKALIKMMRMLGKHKMPSGDMKQAKNAGVLIIAIGDTRKQINLPGQKYAYDGERIKLKRQMDILDVNGLYYSSMANAFLQMITAAVLLGLGSQYVSIVSSPHKEKMLRETLNIPDYMRIYDAAAIGYPAYKPRKKYMRELEEILHFDKYDVSKSWSDATIYERAQNRQDMKFLPKNEFAEAQR